MKEKTKYDGFTYIWEQASYYPITGEMTCYIHFKFPDGSKMKRAFEYTWRLWTLPEIVEMLGETGFKNPTVYWEGTDEDGEGDGVFTPEERGEAGRGMDRLHRRRKVRLVRNPYGASRRPTSGRCGSERIRIMSYNPGWT